MFEKLVCYSIILVTILRASVFKVGISEYLYYGSFLFLVIYSLKSLKVNILSLLFVFAGCISIIVNDIDVRFQPWFRLAAFCIVIMAIGPLNESVDSIKRRFLIFKHITFVIVLATLISFLCYFLSIPQFFHEGKSLYKGLFSHSMLLGPMTAVSTLACLYYYYAKKPKKRQKIVIIGSMVLSFLCCLLAGSRAALGGLIIASFFLMFAVYKEQKKKLLMAFSGFCLVGVLLAPLWYPYTENIRMKQEASEGNLYSTREDRWNDRINEINTNPIFGNGFASMNLEISKVGYMDDGTVEPGSSWLFILSSMGIIGFIIFFMMVIMPLLKIYKSKIAQDNIVYLLYAIIIFFSIHMLAEGYVTASGSFLFFYVWLCIGLIQRKSLTYLNSVCSK